jgi:glycyl-tRNA synthetase
LILLFLCIPTVWKASGHVDAFNDPLIDNKDSKKRYRADVLIEEFIEKLEEKITKEVEKAAKTVWRESLMRRMFRQDQPRVLIWLNVLALSVKKRFINASEKSDLTEIRQIIIDCEIADPVSGSRNWTEVRQFNLMFDTKAGIGK